jgi:putative drug exporter of the RND superfamily
MFSYIAEKTAKYKIPIIIAWLVMAGILTFFAPSLSQVGVTDDSQFLPKDTESARSRELINSRFPSSISGPAGSAIMVIYNPDRLSSKNTQEAQSLHDWLRSAEAPGVITDIVSVFDNQALRSKLISQDQTVMLMQINLSSASSSAPSRQAVKDIRSYILSQQPESQIFVTGSAGISNDLLTSVQNTIDKATIVTVILVVVLLLFIYRSPVAIFVPLITIAVSYLVARGIAGNMASSGMKISSLADAYLVVTLFGIGTDYCLFIVSRFKEELARNDRSKAGIMALKQIGPVILASATTVIVALLCLGISRFGMNRTSGFVLAIGVAITFLASLTLTPALMSFFGKKLLWPASFQPHKSNSEGFWSRIGRRITRQPALFAIPILVILVLPYIALPGIHTSAEILSQMPQNVESVKGFNVLRAHFAAAELEPSYVLIESGRSMQTDPAVLNEIGIISESLKGIKGISRVDYFSAPVKQLLEMSQGSKVAGAAAANGNIAQLAYFQTVGQNLQALAVQNPGLLQSPNFQQIAGNLTQISVQANRLMTSTPQDRSGLIAQITSLSDSVSGGLQKLTEEYNLQTATPFTETLKANYFSTDGYITRINIILSTDPYDQESVKTVNELRDVLHKSISASVLKGSASYIGGETASQTDILSVNNTDFLRVLALAFSGILIISAILLRSLIAPLYMLLTVLLNFGATLGIATWLFLDILDQSAVIYMLPIFVFVILVAVGSDYNIFLVSRIREESRNRPLKEAISISISNTGGVITACGIILAGTFGALMTASLQLVFQVGAAIAIGVLIDTFLVRAIVVPSLAAMLGRWNWWPSKFFRK